MPFITRMSYSMSIQWHIKKVAKSMCNYTYMVLARNMFLSVFIRIEVNGRKESMQNETIWMNRQVAAAMVTGHITPIFTNGDSLHIFFPFFIHFDVVALQEEEKKWVIAYFSETLCAKKIKGKRRYDNTHVDISIVRHLKYLMIYDFMCHIWNRILMV